MYGKVIELELAMLKLEDNFEAKKIGQQQYNYCKAVLSAKIEDRRFLYKALEDEIREELF